MISQTVDAITSPVLPTPAVMMSRRMRQISSSLSLRRPSPAPSSTLVGISAAISLVRTSSCPNFPSLISLLLLSTIGRKGISTPTCFFPGDRLFKSRKTREETCLTTRKSRIACLLRDRKNLSCPFRFVKALMNSNTPRVRKIILSCFCRSSIHAMACSASFKIGFRGGILSRSCLQEKISSEKRTRRRIDCERATQKAMRSTDASFFFMSSIIAIAIGTNISLCSSILSRLKKEGLRTARYSSQTLSTATVSPTAFIGHPCCSSRFRKVPACSTQISRTSRGSDIK
mmetsp:Transcript_14711/g.33778  ORF Transcript_14711/g.33778 Transcript_14711/m.33778 type:complete len:287 (-) Transcript_14711:370-1230(-)